MGQDHESIVFKLRLKIYFRDCFCCRYCGKHMNPLDDDITIDHIDPLGDNSETNLVTACWRCNSRKRDRHAKEFMSKRADEIQKEISGVTLSIAAGSSCFPRMLERSPAKESIGGILAKIAEESGTTVRNITSPLKSKDLVTARRLFVRRARDAGYPLTEIGQAIKRHHTSVLHLLNTDIPKGNVEDFASNHTKNHTDIEISMISTGPTTPTREIW